MPVIPFSEWRPDVADYNQEHSQTLENVLPRGDGYGPLRALSALTDALPAACRGAFLGVNTDGSIAVFAGTATKIYKLNNTDLSWGDVSKASATAISGGTNIGNATGGGGLAAAFDTTTAQAAAACASKAASASAYVGKTPSAATAITSATIYGSNDAGFCTGANPSVTITMYGKQGTAPANGTDGTSIGSVTFTDTADESAGRSITSNSNVIWDHIWVNVVPASGTPDINIAEVKLFPAGSYTTLSADDQWQFAQFNDFLIAVQQNVAPQRFTLASSLSFADLGGSPPQAKYVTVVASHVVLSGLLNLPKRIAWSARDDSTGWTAGTDGSDTQDFPDGGEVRGVAGGEFGVVFQENVIRRMTFIPGSDLIFEFDRISTNEGLRAPYSLIQAGPRIFFLGLNGFQVITAGSPPEPISMERWSRTFFADWDESELGLMIGAVDPTTTRVFWFYKSSSGTTGLFNKGIIYDWVLQRAVPIDGVSGEYVASLSQPGVTLEGLETLGFTDIDTMTISFDDFTGSTYPAIACFDSTHKMGFLNGSTLEATLETGEVGFDRRYFVRQFRPVTDADTAYGYIKYRQKIADTPTSSAESAMNATGFCPLRVDGRLMRFGLRIPAGETWTYAMGAEPQSILTGDR